jgi:NAD(P)-dependent dehydrogenase (short-subunit alcohol dehydrogenase family)
MRVDDKIALITGGTSGIGLAAALRLRRAGAYVIATGRESDRLSAARALLKDGGEARVCDITDPEAIEGLMNDVGSRHVRLDVLVINAGVSNAPAIDALTPRSFDNLMNVNTRGAVFTFVHALPLLADGASVIFTGSVASRKGQPGDPVYAGSKGFIRAFARSAGTDPELMKRRLRINVVTPGPTETPMTEQATSDDVTRQWVSQLIPMRRWGRAEEVAEAILFLASDASSYTTGAEITVDGGMAHG